VNRSKMTALVWACFKDQNIYIYIYIYIKLYYAEADLFIKKQPKTE